MFDEYCKECKYYVQAIDGEIVHEVCLMTKDKDTEMCVFRAVRNIGAALSDTFVKTASSLTAALNKALNRKEK